METVQIDPATEGVTADVPEGVTAGVTVLSTGDLHALGTLVAGLDAGEDPAELIDQLDALERLKCAAAAAQATVTVELSRHRHRRAATAAERSSRSFSARARAGVDLGVGGEVGLARRESPHAGRRHLRLAHGLTWMPHTRAALAAGELSERRAEIMVTETDDLTAAGRELVDAAVPEMFLGLGDADLTDRVREAVLAIDDRPAAERHRRAVADRQLRTRAVADGMTRITALVPSERVGAILGSLETEATTHKSAHPDDDRGRAQRVLDIFIARLSGVADRTPVPVAATVVINATSLLGLDDGPARIAGAGPVPAGLARDLIAAGAGHALSTLQRLFAHPVSGALIAAERTRRCFPTDLAALIRIRDGHRCRTPWCNALIRHIDHPEPAAGGGPTSLHNGQGLCEACNHAKEQPGWRQCPSPEHEGSPPPSHTIEITTPTGHRHRAREPGLPVPRIRYRPGLDLIYTGYVRPA